MKKSHFIIIPAIILLAVGYRFTQIIPGNFGTGEIIESPNKQYSATANEWFSESFWGKERHWFEFIVKDTFSGEVLQKLETDPIAGLYFGSRSNHRVTCWSEDSTEVVFIFPEVEIKMKLILESDSEKSSN